MNFIDILQMVARRRISRATRAALSKEFDSALRRKPGRYGSTRGEMVSLGVADDGTELDVPTDSLCAHGLIVGATGAGKTCAASVLIEAMLKTWGEGE
jgi:hypothetical protein